MGSMGDEDDQEPSVLSCVSAMAVLPQNPCQIHENSPFFELFPIF